MNQYWGLKDDKRILITELSNKHLANIIKRFSETEVENDDFKTILVEACNRLKNNISIDETNYEARKIQRKYKVSIPNGRISTSMEQN